MPAIAAPSRWCSAPDGGLPRHGGRRLRHVVLSFSGAEQRDAATILTRRTFRAAIGLMPADIDLTIETPDSDSAVALVSVASKPGDVIVVGTGGGHLLRHLLHGSARHALWPVVVVPAQVQACPLRRRSPHAGPSAMSGQCPAAYREAVPLDV